MSSAALDEALGDSQRVLVDSSAIIGFHTAAERTHALARHLFRRIEDASDPLTGFFSVVSAAEVLVRPIRTSAIAYAHVHAFLSAFPNFHVLTTDFNTAVRAANLRAKHNLQMPDAIIIASGLIAGCDAIVTCDETWRHRLRPQFSSLRWVYLPSLVA
ncbi:MAG: type II toxin-antitoxin system VapC family toxin [Chloroflexota bacterium]|nr:MAG: type II toxin-antitoxin system VapC family toxin [Chloroflexota bacterium]